MLAMDVVDTLRHREAELERELGGGLKEEELVARLRQIYEAQGIEVPDRILREGIAALKEERFVYRPPEESPATTLARLYVRRGKLAAWAGALLAVILILAGAYWATIIRPVRQLEANLVNAHATVLVLSADPAADARAQELLGQGTAALGRRNLPSARSALLALRELERTLELSYSLIISQGPDTGFWRVPDVNTRARNYYIVVDALDASGRPVSVPVRNEETGRVENVSQWGVRVDEETFERVRLDKLDDGIIQDSLFGVKPTGQLNADYRFPTLGGAVTDWSEW